MRKLKNLVITVFCAMFILPLSSAVADSEGPKGFSIGVIANDMDLFAKGHEIEGISATGANATTDDVTGYKEDKSFSFPSAFIEHTSGNSWFSWTMGAEHIPGAHALTKKSRTDSADANTTGNDSDHGIRTAVAEVSDLVTLYIEPGIQFGDYIGVYGKLGGSHMTLDITQTDTVSDAVSTYQDRDVWGGVYGAGVKLSSPWGIFLKVEHTSTRFRSMNWASNANQVHAQTSMDATRLALGYNF